MKIYQYLRISSADQSNASLDGQDRMNRMFADKHGMIIIDTYIDDGYSAKDFNRPAWKRMREDIRKKQEVQGVIVWKYDRMIRNVFEALQFLKEAESTLKITIFSAMETFSIDPHSPMFFKIRADILVNAEFERRMIAERTNFGIWSSLTQGRYINKAPYGYINGRDDNGKPAIFIDESQAEVVIYIFSASAKGYPLSHIIKEARKMGYDRVSKSSVARMIKNPTYKGYVRVPRYKDNKSKVIRGNHMAIISEDLWNECNADKSDKPADQYANEHLPLRGYVKCGKCNHPLTGSKTKGRNDYYYYYRCLSCNNVNINTNKVEKDIARMLRELSLRQVVVDAIESEVLTRMISSSAEADAKKRQSIDKKAIILKEIETLEKKYFEEKIDDDTYQKWRRRYNADINSINAEITYLDSLINIDAVDCQKTIKKLTNLGNLYQIATPEQKKELVGFIFNGLYLESNRTNRTAGVNEIFSENVNKIRDLGLIEISNGTFELGAVAEGTPYAPPIEHLLLLINKIAS